MDVGTSLRRSFGREHFGAAELGDGRRTRRLVKAADAILRHPGGTLPQKLRTWADLLGLYRLVQAEAVTHEAVLAPHRRLTLSRMGERAAGGGGGPPGRRRGRSGTTRGGRAGCGRRAARRRGRPPRGRCGWTWPTAAR